MIRLWLLLPLLAAAQDFTDYTIEKVFTGYRFTEAPAWSPDKFLVFADVPTNRILKWTSGARPEVLRENAGGPTGLAFDAQGRLYVCEARERRVVRIDKHGKVETLADKFQGRRLNAPNDIVVRRDGHAWFTDPAFGYQADSRELDFYGVYHLTPKGELEVVARLEGRPNGIALAPNGKTLYVANSDAHSILTYDLERGGASSNERPFITGIDGVPDGIRLDEKGNLYIAARHVLVYSPEGKLIHRFEFSEKPSNLTFGDPDLQTLYVTARTSVYRIRLNVKGVAAY